MLKNDIILKYILSYKFLNDVILLKSICTSIFLNLRNRGKINSLKIVILKNF